MCGGNGSIFRLFIPGFWALFENIETHSLFAFLEFLHTLNPVGMMERNDKTIAKICQKKQNAHHCKWFAKQQVLHAKLPSESELEKFLKVYPPSYTHSYTMMTKQHTNIWTKESVPKCSNLCRYYYYSLRVVAIWVMFQVSKNQKKKKQRVTTRREPNLL